MPKQQESMTTVLTRGTGFQSPWQGPAIWRPICAGCMCLDRGSIGEFIAWQTLVLQEVAHIDSTHVNNRSIFNGRLRSNTPFSWNIATPYSCSVLAFWHVATDRAISRKSLKRSLKIIRRFEKFWKIGLWKFCMDSGNVNSLVCKNRYWTSDAISISLFNNRYLRGNPDLGYSMQKTQIKEICQ